MKGIVVLLGICLCIQLCCSEPMKLIHVRDPEAVCNDGSPAGYYYRPGNQNRWNIHQQGGAWCWNKENCEERWSSSRSLMSSKSWATQLSIGGLFDESAVNNPDWYSASKVFIGYCSSDSFSGNRSASPSTGNWHFKGKAILRAVIQDLLSKTGLSNAQEVLFSGCSAGGSAVFANLDYAASLLPHKANRVFKGHADAGWFLLTKPMTNIPAPYQVIFTEGIQLWGGIANEECTKTEKETWKCYLGQFVHKYLKTPVLVFEETEDQVQLWRNQATAPWNKEKLDYVQYFRQHDQYFGRFTTPTCCICPRMLLALWY